LSAEPQEAPAGRALDDRFERVALEFVGGLYENVFALKNDKTVAETLAHHRYSALKSLAVERYPEQLHEPLGTFLLSLKMRGDAFYRRFLNRYGDLTYCQFRIADSAFLDAKGVYSYLLDDEVVYVGRCRDSMRQRVNQGYGKIHPKNCYRDGQSRNCHLNACIAEVVGRVTLRMRPMPFGKAIAVEEQRLIQLLRPMWNVRGVG